MTRLRFNIDRGQGIGGTLHVTADAARVDEEGYAALRHLAMMHSADAREAAEWLGVRSIRPLSRRDPRFPRPFFLNGHFRWWRDDLDAYADASGL